MDRISIVIPVYNNEKHIRRNIEFIINYFEKIKHIYNYELIVINDGSTDKTALILSNIRHSKIKVFSYLNSGKGAALMRGFWRSKGDLILFLDCDLQLLPQELPTFFILMKIYNAGAVIGNKRHNFSIMKYGAKRAIISTVYNIICRALFNIPLRDTQCGIKLFRKEALKKVYPKILVKRFAFDIELIVALRDNNIRVVDAPVSMLKKYNKGSVSLKNIIYTFIDTLAVFYRRKKGWYICTK